ncbi:hypothetical protein DT73_13175 [Mangrovibacter sp. MFB070]|uniref:hypothetical protein n=1 Tax=Mangrovibacter sp. MFB070 TaxID=1224318 RepID=UPI0004D8614D|nr:hypothetical protein [Mangrovibacter sp. MFB070]KEA51880.1 hypothetical protein DT73_13175 [Mangrovibacter sp. MFB070]
MEEIELRGPTLSDRSELKEAANRLREAVMNGTVQDKILSRALRKELKGTDSLYDGEWNLKHNQYISNVFEHMDLTNGVNLINASVGTGKTTQFIEVDGNGKPLRAKEGYIVLVPLTSIRLSFNGDNDVFSTGICTWNKIETINNHPNKEYFKDKTLVIDEVHGFFLDYDYKAMVINRLIASFPLFKSVIMMSGTAEAEDFSGIDFNKTYRIYKPSQARKILNTVVTSNPLDLVLKQLNEGTRKTIVLINDKAQCESLNQMCLRNGLTVNADKKNNQEVIDLFVTGEMNHDVLFGTYSIVEGLSIINKLDEVDVIIVGHEHPARIEQFTNRFRRVSDLKNVTYYLRRSEQIEVGIFNRNAVVNDAKIMKDMLQVTYDALHTDEAKQSFTNQYRKDIAGSMVYFHDGEFHVSYTGIDFNYTEHQRREFANDFNLLSEALSKYDFIVNPIHFIDGDGENERVINDTSKKVKEEAIEAENAIIREYMADAIAGNVKPSESVTELYNTTHESVEKLFAKGLRPTDFESLMEGFIEDRTYFYRAHVDAEYFPTGNTIRELIAGMIGTDTYLDSFKIRDIADAVIIKVLNEYFAGDKTMMLKHPLWKKAVVQDGSNLVSSSSKGAKAILERYITLGKGEQIRVNGVRVSACEVIHLSLTGLHFDKPAYIRRTTEHVEVNQSLVGLKEKLNQLRM